MPGTAPGVGPCFGGLALAAKPISFNPLIMSKTPNPISGQVKDDESKEKTPTEEAKSSQTAEDTAENNEAEEASSEDNRVDTETKPTDVEVDPKAYKAAQAESKKNAQRARELEEKLKLAEDKQAVLQDKTHLFDIHRQNPERAETLAQEIYGKSIDDMYDTIEDEIDDEDKRLDIKISKRMANLRKADLEAEEVKAINELEAQFFVENGIDFGGDDHKSVLKEYRELGGGKSLDQSRKILDLVAKARGYDKVAQTQAEREDKFAQRQAQAANIGAGGAAADSGKEPEKLTPAAQNFFGKLGVDPQQVQKRIEQKKK